MAGFLQCRTDACMRNQQARAVVFGQWPAAGQVCRCDADQRCFKRDRPQYVSRREGTAFRLASLGDSAGRVQIGEAQANRRQYGFNRAACKVVDKNPSVGEFADSQ
jgi:hypothetical protein